VFHLNFLKGVFETREPKPNISHIKPYGGPLPLMLYHNLLHRSRNSGTRQELDLHDLMKNCMREATWASKETRKLNRAYFRLRPNSKFNAR